MDQDETKVNNSPDDKETNMNSDVSKSTEFSNSEGKADIGEQMDTSDDWKNKGGYTLGGSSSSGSSGLKNIHSNQIVSKKKDLAIAGPSSKVEELTNEQVDQYISKEALEHYQYSGDRHILVYDERLPDEEVFDPKTVPEEEFPDDFFELSVGEAQKLFRELKQTRDQLENSQLTTRAMRELKTGKKILATLHQYMFTVIRVHFPDGHVLQAVFKPLENMAKIKQVVRTCLTKPDLNFYLYTTPPKTILEDSASTLLDLKCVPTGNFYFGVSLEESETSDESLTLSFVKSELLNTKVTRRVADANALDFRKARNPDENTTEFDPTTKEPARAEISVESACQSKPVRPKTSSDKIPKWFKTGK